MTPLVSLAALVGVLATPGTPSAADTWAARIDDSFRAADAVVPVREGRLDKAASEVSGAANGAAVRATLRDAGVYEGVVVPLTLDVSQTDVAAPALDAYVAGQLAPARITHYGLFARGDRVDAVFVRRALELDEARPRGWGGAEWSLRGRMEPGYQAPEVFIARSDGGVVSRALPTHGRWIDAWLGPALLDGARVVEVVAVGPSGREVVALMPWGPIRAGVRPDLPTVRLVPSGTASEPALELVELVNQARAGQGLPRLRPDRRLARSARRHANAMARHQRVAHRLPGGAGAAVRVANPRGGRFYENLAAAASVAEAHAEIWASPSHRAALLDGRITHIGVGVVRVDTAAGPVVYVAEHVAQR